MASRASAPLPPAHSRIPVVGSLPALRHGLLEAFVEGWHTHGDIVLYRVPRPMIVFAHPDHVQHFFHDHHDHHPRSWLVRERLKDMMGEGLFNHDGEAYHRDLRLIEPRLEEQRTAMLERWSAEVTDAMLDRWATAADARQEIDVYDEMQRLNLDIMGRVLFGADWDRFGTVMRDAVTAVNDYLIPRVTGFPTPLEPLTPWHRRYRRSLATADRIIFDAIAARRDRPTSDLVSGFVHARDETTGVAMTDREIRFQVMTMIFGFFKSVGINLAWTWYLLAKNPGARERLYSEVASVLGNRPPAIGDVPQLHYTKMVVAEVLRLYPPLYIIARPPKEDEVFEGYLIPSDMFCLFLPYITHRHPASFENPESFDPERFAPGRTDQLHPFGYYPFAIGPRRCPGEAFAMTEVQLIIARIARRYALDLVPGHEIRRRGIEFLLRPINGMPMTLRPASSL